MESREWTRSCRHWGCHSLRVCMMEPHWSRANKSRQILFHCFQVKRNQKMSLSAGFWNPSVPQVCQLQSASWWLFLAVLRAFIGHPRQREGGREFPGHLLAPLTYYLPQLEQHPSPALLTPFQLDHTAFNPNVYRPKASTFPLKELIYYSTQRLHHAGAELGCLPPVRDPRLKGFRKNPPAGSESVNLCQWRYFARLHGGAGHSCLFPMPRWRLHVLWIICC